MRRPRIRFWQKVLAALIVVGVAPIALVSVVSTNNTRNDLTALGVTNIRQRSTSTANAIDAYLASRLGDIILVAKLPDIIKYATAHITEMSGAANSNPTQSAKQPSNEMPMLITYRTKALPQFPSVIRLATENDSITPALPSAIK